MMRTVKPKAGGAVANEHIYRKTEKGRNEIATRANRLGLRERAMLILVGEQSTRQDLLAKNSHPTSEGIINNLLADGYIEFVSGQGAPAAAAAPVPAVPGTSDPTVEVSMASCTRYACRTLVTLLGPMADDLTAIVERAKTPADLGAALQKCRDAIQAMGGKKKADEFYAGATARLPRS